MSSTVLSRHPGSPFRDRLRVKTVYPTLSRLQFRAISSTPLGGPRSHAASATDDTLPAVRPVAHATTAPAVARRPRPPTGPAAPRPAAAAPEPRLASGCPHHHLGFALRTVPAPADMGA